MRTTPDIPTPEVHLRDYWKVVWQGRWTVLALFLLVLGAGTAWTFLQTPIYRATAVVEVQPQPRRLTAGQDASGMGAGGYGWFAEEKYQNTQIEIIRSRDVASRAFDILGLRTHPQFAGLADPVGAFAARIQVEPRRETGLVEISIQGPDRDEAARWVNAVADQYVERNLNQARDNARSSVEAIRSQIKLLKDDLEASEKRKFEVLQQTQIYSPEAQQDILKQRLQRLSATLAETNVKVAHYGSLLANVRDLRQRGADPMTIPELASDPFLKELNLKRGDLEKELDGLKATYRAGHPVYQEKVQQLDRINRQVVDQVNVNLTKIQNQYDVEASNAAQIREEIRKAEQSAYQVGMATSEYDSFKIDAETRRQLLDLVTRRMQEIDLGAQLLANNVSVLDHAIPPRAPIKPKKAINLLISALLGLFAGMAAVFFLDYLDNTFRSAEEIEKRLGLNTLAIIPKFAGGDRGERAVREAYQSLRTSLIFSSLNRERKVVLVTSTAPQEGKSSTAAQLARTLAGAGERVIVVDCDLRRPTQHLHLQVPREPGLTNYLSAGPDARDWSPYLRRGAPGSPDVLPCGTIPPNPPELLGAERFSGLLRELREAYDWVILDSPPSSSLSDAVLLSSKADMVLLVIRHAATDRDHVARATAQFRNVQAVIAGVVLNNVDLARAWQKDYYYAGYYYTEDAEAGRVRRRKSRDGAAQEEAVGR